MNLIYPNFWSHIFETRHTYVDINYISAMILIVFLFSFGCILKYTAINNDRDNIPG